MLSPFLCRFGTGILSGVVLCVGLALPARGFAQPTQEVEPSTAGTASDPEQALPASEPSEDAPREDVEAETPEEAVELYRRGREAYRAGRYDEAIILLKGALAQDPESPTLMYNVAKVSELLGNLDEAIDYYDAYLHALPPLESAERRSTRETLRRLRGAQKANVVPERSDQAEPAEMDSASPAMGRADTLFWLTGSAGAVLLLGGTVVGILALGQQSTANDFVLGQDGTAAEWGSARDRADHLALGADVLLVAGVAALTGTALLYLLREEEVEQAVTVGLRLGGLDLRGRF